MIQPRFKPGISQTQIHSVAATSTSSVEGICDHIKVPGEFLYLMQEFQLLKTDSSLYSYSFSELGNMVFLRAVFMLSVLGSCTTKK
jgi:hypothetical protein